MIRGKNYIGRSSKLEWEAKDLDYLRAHYATDSNDDIAIHLGVSAPTVKAKAVELGLSKKTPHNKYIWTDEQLRYLREKYPAESGNDIADYLGVSSTLVCKKAKEMGLEKSKEWNKGLYHRRYVRNYRNAV